MSESKDFTRKALLFSSVVVVCYLAALFTGVFDAAEARIKARGELAKAERAAAAAAVVRN